MLKALRYDLKKNFFSVNFLLGIVVVFLLICATSYEVAGGESYMSYPFLKFIFETDSKLWESNYFYSGVKMFEKGFSNRWTAIFLPVITGIACVPMLCDELNTNTYRMSVIRLGKTNFILSKFFSAIITAVVIIVIPYIIFAVYCMVVFPSLEFYIQNADSGYAEKLVKLFEMQRGGFNKIAGNDNAFITIAGRIMTSSIFSAIPCLLAMLLGAITRNKFVSLSLPVMFYFAVTQIMANVTSKAFENSGKTPGVVFFDPSERFYNVEFWFKEYTNLGIGYIYLYALAVTIVLFILFNFVMRRRVEN